MCVWQKGTLGKSVSLPQFCDELKTPLKKKNEVFKAKNPKFVLLMLSNLYSKKS